jgi:hypothetical protein
MVEQAVYTALTSDSAVTTFCGTRIYPLLLPTSPTLPAIDYKIIGGGNTPTFTTMGTQRYRVEVNCWGATYADAVTLRHAVVKALSGYQSGNTAIEYLMPQDFFEPDLLQYRACAEFYVYDTLQ